MARATYTADLPAYEAFGGGTPDPPALGVGWRLALHVWPVVVSSTPGAGLQVTIRWDDGFGPQSDDTVISLDALYSGVFKEVFMWTGFATIGTIEAIMVGATGAEYGIDWEIFPDIIFTE